MSHRIFWSKRPTGDLIDIRKERNEDDAAQGDEREACNAFAVSEYRWAEFQRGFAKLCSKAEKLGCEIPQMKYVGKAERIYKRRDEAGRLIHPEQTYRIEWHWFTITGDAPSLNGWTFEATIRQSRKEDGTLSKNMIYSVPGCERVPDRFRTCDGQDCDHCQTRRYRKETFVVRKAEDWKLVGRQCLKDFLGHKSPQQLASLCGGWHDLICGFGGDPDDPDYCREGGGGERTWSLAYIIAKTARVIASEGWMSATKSREIDGHATRYNVSLYLSSREKMGAYEKARVDLWDENETPSDEKIAECIAWASDEGNADGSSDYMHNLAVIADRDYVTSRDMGIAVSLWPVWRRKVERDIQDAAQAEAGRESAWQGAIGDKLLTMGLVTGVRECGGEWGISELITWTDADGNRFKWFSSGGGSGVNPGDRIAIRGTVKKHDEFRGVKQTMMTRCDYAVPGQKLPNPKYDQAWNTYYAVRSARDVAEPTVAKHITLDFEDAAVAVADRYFNTMKAGDLKALCPQYDVEPKGRKGVLAVNIAQAWYNQHGEG